MGRRTSGTSINPVTRAILWILLTLGFALVADQCLIHLPDQPAALKAARTFYKDFRQRLFALGGPQTIEDVLQQAPPPVPAQPSPGERRAFPPAPAPAQPQRYLYVDSQGELQFAESLEEVPQAFRKDAKPMGP